jgi:hypothetical protein
MKRLDDGITTHIARFYGQGSEDISVTGILTGSSLSTTPRRLCIARIQLEQPSSYSEARVGANKYHEFGASVD